MSESFMSVSRRKTEIEQEISELDKSSAYKLIHTSSDFMQQYENTRKRLEEYTRNIAKSIDDLTGTIENLIRNIYHDTSISPESKQIQKKKASNIESQVNELQSFLRRTSNKKFDELRNERDKFNLYGSAVTGNISSSENLARNSQMINNNQRMTSEMLGSGRDILHSFRNQSSTLRNVQKKVVNIVKELGLTGQLLRVIGDRSRGDNIIILILFIILAAFIALCYFIIRPLVKE